MRIAVILCIAALALLSSSCSKHEATPAASMTEAQHDSVLARSSVPGAAAVGAALGAAGKEAQRSAAMDSSAH